MSALATKRRFGQRRAVVCDRVVLAAPKHDDPAAVCLRAGIVVAIAGKADRPYILDVRAGTVDWDAPAWRFVECRTEADVEALPAGAWTWPDVELRDAAADVDLAVDQVHVTPALGRLVCIAGAAMPGPRCCERAGELGASCPKSCACH